MLQPVEHCLLLPGRRGAQDWGMGLTIARPVLVLGELVAPLVASRIFWHLSIVPLDFGGVSRTVLPIPLIF